jgi:hypothetical protein
MLDLSAWQSPHNTWTKYHKSTLKKSEVSTQSSQDETTNTINTIAQLLICIGHWKNQSQQQFIHYISKV